MLCQCGAPLESTCGVVPVGCAAAAKTENLTPSGVCLLQKWTPLCQTAEKYEKVFGKADPSKCLPEGFEPQ